MLPSINTQNWTELSDNWVLVGVGLDGDLAGLVVLDEPGPSGALDASEGGVEGTLELLEGAERVINSSLLRLLVNKSVYFPVKLFLP